MGLTVRGKSGANIQALASLGLFLSPGALPPFLPTPAFFSPFLATFGACFPPLGASDMLKGMDERQYYGEYAVSCDGQ